MVKCPKCGIKGWKFYYPIAILDTDYDDDKIIQTNKVECMECHHHYTVKEIYTLTFDTSYNVD